MGGVTVSAGVCGVKVLGYAIENGYLQDAIAKTIFNKLIYNSEKSLTRDFIYVENIIFETRDAAERAFNDAFDILGKYGTISVEELHYIAGNTDVNYIDTKYGWTSTNNFKLLRTRKGYELSVPRAMRIE